MNIHNRQVNSSPATQTQVHLAAEPTPLATKPHCNTASCFCTSHLPGVLAFPLPPVAIASIAPDPAQISWHQVAPNIHIAPALPPPALEGSRHASCSVMHDRDGTHVCLLGHSAGGLCEHLQQSDPNEGLLNCSKQTAQEKVRCKL